MIVAIIEKDPTLITDKPVRVCRIWYCQKRVYALRLCNKHYNVMLRSGTVPSPHNEDLQDVLRFVDCLAEAARAMALAFQELQVVSTPAAEAVERMVAELGELLAVYDGAKDD